MQNLADIEYLSVLQKILDNGIDVLNDRTGVGRRKLIGAQMRFNLAQGFPILTTKKVAFNSVKKELIWFLSGSTNIEWLVQNGVKIWNEWPCEKWLKQTGISINFAKGSPEWQTEFNKHLEVYVDKIRTDHDFALKFGELGKVYGGQWRNFGETKDDNGNLRGDGVDQISQAIEMIQNDPTSTRIIVTGWNAKEVGDVALPPCHTTFQFVILGGKLNCHMWMRSADAFLGVPFNIASYALLTHMMAQVTNLQVGDLVISFSDIHIYLNQLEQVNEQLKRAPGEFPQLQLNPKVKNIFEFKPEDIDLIGYNPQAAIKAQVAV